MRTTIQLGRVWEEWIDKNVLNYEAQLLQAHCANLKGGERVEENSAMRLQG